MVDLHARGPFNLPYMLQHFHPDIVKITIAVFVLDYSHWKVYLLIEVVAREVLVMFRDIIIDFNPQSHTCLIGPASRDILDCISSTSHHNRRQTVV